MKFQIAYIGYFLPNGRGDFSPHFLGSFSPLESRENENFEVDLERSD